MNTLLRSASVLAIALAAYAASAAPATYTVSGVGSGTLDGKAFTNQSFSIVGTGDTSTITGASGSFPTLYPTTTTASVTGIGSDSLTDTINVTDNRSNSLAGFGDTSENLAILFVTNAAFSTYGLATSIGPLSGAPTLNGGDTFPTLHGQFSLTTVTSASFAANVQPTPEPSALAALGLGAVAVLRRRRRA